MTKTFSSVVRVLNHSGDERPPKCSDMSTPYTTFPRSFVKQLTAQNGPLKDDGGKAHVVRRAISAQRGLIDAAEVVDSSVARGSSGDQGLGAVGRRCWYLLHKA
ncbi:hypothetical protein CBL_08678 [Carabus blaptoides fortunei]